MRVKTSLRTRWTLLEGVGSNPLSRPSAPLMDNQMHSLNKQFYRGWRRVACFAGIFNGCGQAWKMRNKHRREVLDAPRSLNVTTDF
jgi:hypothetical protein